MQTGEALGRRSHSGKDLGRGESESENITGAL